MKATNSSPAEVTLASARSDSLRSLAEERGGLRGIDEQLLMLDPISLDEINSQARLMTRVDRKYFLPRELFVELLATTRDEFKILEIEGQRRFEYRTVYYDSPDFRFFRDHVQDRRHRFKVRTRTYVDTGTCHLEVKSKGYRGQTIKQRISHPIHSPLTLTNSDVAFIDSVIGDHAGRGVHAADLAPVLETVYDRITLCHEAQRLTCDLDIESLNDVDGYMGPKDILVETKSAGGVGVWDNLLKQAGIREHKVSKYCVGASLLYPELPSNPWARTIKRYFKSAEDR